MRDFKFRVWCRGWKPARYASNDELHITNGRFSNILKNFFNGNLYIVEQFTGLKDKNDKDVYEGDLVRVWQSPKYKKGKVTHYGSEFLGKVIYRDGNYWVEGRKKGASLCIFYGNTELSKIEVIGNINENLDYMLKW